MNPSLLHWQADSLPSERGPFGWAACTRGRCAQPPTRTSGTPTSKRPARGSQGHRWCGPAARRAVCGTRGSLRTMHGGGSAPSCCAFTHRVVLVGVPEVLVGGCAQRPRVQPAQPKGPRPGARGMTGSSGSLSCSAREVRCPCAPGYSVHGVLQARILEWFAIPFSRGSSQARD